MKNVVIAITASWYLLSWFLAYVWNMASGDWGYREHTSQKWNEMWQRWVPPIIAVSLLSRSQKWIAAFVLLCLTPRIREWWQRKTYPVKHQKWLEQKITTCIGAFVTHAANGTTDAYHIYSGNIDPNIIFQDFNRSQKKGIECRYIKSPKT